MLLEDGYTIVWVGWQFDVPADNDPYRLRLFAPVATQNGQALTGLVRSEIITSKKQFSHSLADRNHVPYEAANPADPAIQLTVKDGKNGKPRALPRKSWQFARDVDGKPVADPGHVFLSTGFEPGRIYEVVYTAKNPALVGLGPAAVRDLISFLKYGGNGVTLLGDQSRHLKRAIGFGTSQSGRFLRAYLYYGFNKDEKDRKVFDGVWAHVAGAGRGSFNHRFAQASRDGHPFMNHDYPTDIFPFTDLEQTDPETGARGSLLGKAAAENVLPKIFYTNGSYEYLGRAAALIHSGADGKSDAPLPKDTRVYFLTGTQHGPGAFPPARPAGTTNLANSNNYRYPMRALLGSFNRWVTEGVEPPASAYPRIDKDQLVAPGALNFPKVPGAVPPTRLQTGSRLDFGPRFATEGIVTQEPPKAGKPFPVLLPQVDTDGNETSGIRMPLVTVPLATYTGWNYRDAAIGGVGEVFDMVGSTFPFARTKAERQKSGDPRPSIEERYPTREGYLNKVRSAAAALVQSGYLLQRDVEEVLRDAATRWDTWAGR